MSRLKRLEYPAFLGKGYIVYLIEDTSIYFSGHTLGATTTINAAENIIACIANQESIDPMLYDFYDIQTCLGYEGHAPGWFEIDQVIFQVEDARVTKLQWRRVAGGGNLRGADENGALDETQKGIPAHVLKEFHRYISA
jgi:hypothetical protein